MVNGRESHEPTLDWVAEREQKNCTFYYILYINDNIIHFLSISPASNASVALYFLPKIISSMIV